MMDGVTKTRGGSPRARRMTNSEWLNTSEGRVIDEQQRVNVETAVALGRAMRRVGLSNEDLARELGVNRSVISRMLAGERPLSLERLAHAFHVLGFSMRVSYGPAVKQSRVRSS